jgi:MOSC domain-containing protein YiiM
MRAVSLYSFELINALRAEGHAIDVGCIGENFTLTGVPWERMLPGATLDIGDVQLELTAYAAPCNNLLPYFAGGKFVRVAQKVHPGWSRLYARVLREGSVQVGDAVSFAP